MSVRLAIMILVVLLGARLLTLDEDPEPTPREPPAPRRATDPEQRFRPVKRHIAQVEEAALSVQGISGKVEVQCADLDRQPGGRRTAARCNTTRYVLTDELREEEGSAYSVRYNRRHPNRFTVYGPR